MTDLGIKKSNRHLVPGPQHCIWSQSQMKTGDPAGITNPSMQRQYLTGTRYHTLPLVLLGIHAAFREDLDCSSAELVYGSTLRLPGEFYASPTSTSPDQSNFSCFLVLQPVCRRSTHRCRKPESVPSGSTVTYPPPPMCTCALILVYSHLALAHTTSSLKYYLLDLNGQQYTVSVDRLKPAYLPNLDVSLLDPLDDLPVFCSDAPDPADTISFASPCSVSFAVR